MKTIKGVIIGAVALLFASAVHTFAIEGLQVSVQCSNVVLRWPSDEFIGETYIVQYRPDLTSTNPWTTLTNNMPPDTGTNITYFVHSNVVQNPCNCDGSGSFSSMSSGGSMSRRASLNSGISVGLRRAEALLSQSQEPLAMLNSDWNSLLPAAIYPPGFDFSGFSIFDPASGEWLDGQYYTAQAAILRATLTLNGAESDGPLEPGGGSGSGDSSFTPETGFYQVVREGVHIIGLTNLTSAPVSNTIALPFEAGNDIGMLQEVYVLIDGMPCRGSAALVGPPFYPGILTVDTAFLENGDHTFQVEAGWQNPDLNDLNNSMIHRVSDSFTLTVSNVIYYPDWEEEMGEYGFSAYFVKTTCTNADWQIDIYDVRTNFVQSLAGHTTDGIIEAYWNLIDTNGVTRTNSDYDPEFKSIITVADPIVMALPAKKPVPTYPTHGQWVIAYQDNFSFCASSNHYYEAISNFGGIAAGNGGAYTTFPSNPTNGQTFPLRYPYTNPVVNVSVPTMMLDVRALEALLVRTNSRNFYYNGHGAAQGIANYLSSERIKSDLKGRYFRFVFLDSCSTAKGKLAAAFGNNATTTQPLSYYQQRGIRPRAFLGYDHDVHYLEGGSFYDPYDGGTYSRRVKEEVWEFLGNFEFYWYFGYYGSDLASVIYHAYLDTPSLPYGWQNGAGLQIYGYSGLGIDDYNTF